MTSGRKLTEQQRDTILRLASYRDEQGTWLLTYEAISDQVGLDSHTVSDVVRRAAAAWWNEHRWHVAQPGESPD